MSPSAGSSTAPSLAPSPTPSESPSTILSTAPSGAPSISPSRSKFPSLTPSISMAPTLPCNGMSVDDRKMAIAKNIMDISGEGGFDDVEHPVYRAFSWIVEDDPLRPCPDDTNLLQRYALSLLYFATNGDEWIKCDRKGNANCNGQQFLSGSHECSWGGITCDSVDRVQKINIGK